ncbi:hypothetical protein SteCoe_5969 [Stentor coeruleus]|uniref:Uncharacterized protein n=1 Tax=Stentor coeruleus TaxID=5963 RepID=A0A1R2CR60_9CILI|nr:hypothetical protein SteCoe_5969 [Stentor coeruleus]
MESSIVAILQEIKNLTTKVEKVDSKIDTLEKEVSFLGKGFQGLENEVKFLRKEINDLNQGFGNLSTKAEVTGPALVEIVGVLDKLNTNSIRAEEQIKRLLDRHPRID